MNQQQLRDEYHDLITESPREAAEAIGRDFPFVQDPSTLDVWTDVLDEAELVDADVRELYQAFGRGQGQAPLPAGTTALAFVSTTGYEHDDFARNVEALRLEHVPVGDGPQALGVLVFELDKSGKALPVLRRWEPPEGGAPRVQLRINVAPIGVEHCELAGVMFRRFKRLPPPVQRVVDLMLKGLELASLDQLERLEALAEWEGLEP